VALDPKTLPDNPEVLRQMVIELATQLEANQRRLERIQHILEQLLHWRYGQKREKIDENQLFLFAVGLEASGQDVKDFITELEVDQEQKQDDDKNPPASETGDPPAKPRGHGRQRLPKPLRRERIEYDLKEDERQCPHCAQAMRRIGEEISERLEYVPASVVVIEEVRAKYACGCGGGVKTADKPSQPIEKGLAGASMLAQVAVSKYADHSVPRTRQPRWRRGAVREMRVGPSGPAIRSRLQTTASCCR
jgi:transposase